MDLAIVNHVFLTSRYLYKGRVSTGAQRLSSLLASYRPPFLTVDDFTMVERLGRQRVMASRGLLRTRDILFAHEFLEIGGDAYRRTVDEVGSDHRMVSFTLGPVRLEVLGRVRREVIAASAGAEGFFVVLEPRFEGLDVERNAELEVLRSLPYGILNGAHVQCMVPYE